jgi:hypothetical protein
LFKTDEPSITHKVVVGALSKESTLWIECVKTIHKIQLNSVEELGKKLLGSKWSTIANVNDDVKELGKSISVLRRKVAVNSDTQFRHHKWFG